MCCGAGGYVTCGELEWEEAASAGEESTAACEGAPLLLAVDSLESLWLMSCRSLRMMSSGLERAVGEDGPLLEPPGE